MKSIVTLLVALPLISAADVDRRPSIMALMQKQYRVSRAPFKVIQAESDAETPDWAKVEEAGAAFSALADTLSERTPRLGTEESWKGLIRRHLDDARAIGGAARTRDRSALRDVRRRIEESCAACHKAHRGRRGD